ncbi:MAG: isoleucine--tRNA ligase [Candidatus Delongbacteria bacterium]|nr:isoleucine--tRNA ligase [Candidatus Delongbacteria bacterium]
MFTETRNKIDFSEIETKILAFWDEQAIFKKSLDLRDIQNEFVFYDGPPFATGLPHYGHLLAGTLKDIIPRYQTMKGNYVERRFGWDCHGLPVEYEMEKELNLSGKKQIEDYGISKFNESCRGIVLRYTSEWEKTVHRMGRWVDFQHDYKTMDTSYMESIWWVFKEMWDKELIYEGYKVLPFCPRCSTPLSNFETNQGYRETVDPAITVRFKLEDQPATYILAWTTTPWTLPSNLALAVGKDITYIKVRDHDEIYIIAQERIPAYYRKAEEYEIIETLKGSELVGLRYEPLLPYFASQSAQGAFRVIAADFVSTEDGTGIVHIAPAFGEDDFNVCRENGIPLVAPIDDEGRFTAEVGDYQGMAVKEADPLIIRRLKEERKLVKREQITHNYPHCWRCDTPLIYKAISTWFVRIDRIKEQMLASNRQINWVPAHLKEGRFGKWLENARDWAISRNRYWGATIPVWRCSCGQLKAFGSIKELEEAGGIRLTDLHKHVVDEVVVPCPVCGKTMKRIPEVFDCWFESGSMPYAQNHYPFKNKEKFERHFPADFIAEGLDQTRGWFYTLVVISSALFQKPAFKNVIVNGLILAEDGKKMSKRLRNYPEPEFIINRYGADALRLYLVSSPVVRAEDLRFTEEGVKEILRTILIPFWNCYAFLATYAGIDHWVPDPNYSRSPHQLDRWIISVLNKLIDDVNQSMDQYDLQKTVSSLLDFIDLLTNWYIRRSRRRFWKSENDQDKNDAYHTLYTVLLKLSQLMAPFVPFISEAIYLNLKTDAMPESIHLTDFPSADLQARDYPLENQMALVQKAVSMGRSLRIKHNLKIRQPLAGIHLVTRVNDEREILNQMTDLIKEELNVKSIIFDENESALVSFSAKANFKTLGPRYGQLMKIISTEIAALSEDKIEQVLMGHPISLTIDGQTISIGSDEMIVARQEKADLVIENEGTLTVALDSHLTPDLIQEGLVRELVHQIQNHRKDEQLDVTDRIRIVGHATPDLQQAILNYRDYLQAEVLASQIVFSDPSDDMKSIEVNDQLIRLKIEKLS